MSRGGLWDPCLWRTGVPPPLRHCKGPSLRGGLEGCLRHPHYIHVYILIGNFLWFCKLIFFEQIRDWNLLLFVQFLWGGGNIFLRARKNGPPSGYWLNPPLPSLVRGKSYCSRMIYIHFLLDRGRGIPDINLVGGKGPKCITSTISTTKDTRTMVYFILNDKNIA